MHVQVFACCLRWEALAGYVEGPSGLFSSLRAGRMWKHFPAGSLAARKPHLCCADAWDLVSHPFPSALQPTAWHLFSINPLAGLGGSGASLLRGGSVQDVSHASGSVHWANPQIHLCHWLLLSSLHCRSSSPHPCFYLSSTDRAVPWAEAVSHHVDSVLREQRLRSASTSGCLSEY